MNRLLTALLLAGVLLTSGTSASAGHPNIVFILADDMGCGDVRALNPQGKIATPHLDALARAGMVFSDAHTSSSVCTPTRYGVLTGRYNWRSRLASGVLGGYSPRLIEQGRLTVPALLKQHGYHTACIGKWHLGLDWLLKDGGIAADYQDAWQVDYEKPIANGPTSLGFDYFYGISASLDMPPFVFIENDRCVGIPTVEKKWLRSGPAQAEFEAVDVLPRITEKAVAYFEEQAGAARQGEPFFVYFPLTAPHTPILPTTGWQGKSGLSAYGDFVMQVDATVGTIRETLARLNLADNTLLIFTSDNGCSPAANMPEMHAQGHFPSTVYRGHKADIFEGGHRVPFLACWPAKVQAGATSSQLICLNDLLATCADIVGAKLPENAGEDSVSLVPALIGTDKAPLREALVHHSINGSFAIRQGPWKLAWCPDSGGWSNPKPGQKGSESLASVQLYNLQTEIGETTNLQAENPQIVSRLKGLLESYIARGRSTPGTDQSNSRDVDIDAAPRASRKHP